MIRPCSLRRNLPALVSATLLGSNWAAAAPVTEMQMPSCVRGSPPLVVPARAARATLDGADRRLFQQAAEARYPLYRRGGFVPPEVLLLRRGEHWLYVTLFHDSRGRPCVTAVFAAERFDFTDGWIGKYQPREADPSD